MLASVPRQNDLIVDNISNPKIIFGVCDGKGDFKNTSNKQKDYITKILYKNLKKKLEFN